MTSVGPGASLRLHVCQASQNGIMAPDGPTAPCVHATPVGHGQGIPSRGLAHSAEVRATAARLLQAASCSPSCDPSAQDCFRRALMIKAAGTSCSAGVSGMLWSGPARLFGLGQAPGRTVQEVLALFDFISESLSEAGPAKVLVCTQEATSRRQLRAA